MKTIRSQLTCNRMQIPSRRRPGKNSALAALLLCSILITFYGCGKPSDNPTPPPVVNITACSIASDVDQTLGLRNFEYDDKGLLIKVTAPNYYYGAFVRTITPAKVTDVFPNYNASYTYSGGSGNIYDGNPEFIHEPSVKDSVYQFKYDAKKRLVSVLIPMPANGYWQNTFFLLFRAELNFTYDANDNVTQVKIVEDYQEEIKVPQTGQTRIDYMQLSGEELNITYDDKPSAYTTISKYWKFIGADFLGAKFNSLDLGRFWANSCTFLSKNNPVKITGKLKPNFSEKTIDINMNLGYQYNEKNFPVTVSVNGSDINSFTYNCK